MTIVSEQFHAAHRRLFTAVGVTTGTDASGRQQQTPAYLVAPCHIGTLAFTSHRVAVIDLARIGAGDIDVILGYPALRQANWHVDFPLRRRFIQPRCSRIS